MNGWERLIAIIAVLAFGYLVVRLLIGGSDGQD